MTCGTACVSRVVVLMTTILAGCGGSSFPRSGFVNRTGHNDDQLWSLWKRAQRSVSEQIDLNPLQQEQDNASPHLMPGDSRALNVYPGGLLVSPQPDISSATLLADTGERRADPTGLIPCPQICNVHYAPAYSLYRQRATCYAASWESSEPDYDYLLEYEFENQILSSLGYDMRWR